MGGHKNFHPPVTEKELRQTRAHEVLRHHPSFQFPDLEDIPSRREVAEFVIEAIARFVSPAPQEEVEHDEFECIDVAAVIREQFGAEILAKVREAFPPRPDIREGHTLEEYYAARNRYDESPKWDE